MSDSQAEMLRVAERSAGILPIANQWVCAELLSHLADQSDESFRSAWVATRRLAAQRGADDVALLAEVAGLSGEKLDRLRRRAVATKAK